MYKFDTFTQEETVMKTQFKVILALLALALATLACDLPAIPGLNGPLYQDNFDGFDQTWGTGSDSDSTVEYADGGLQFKVHKSLYFVWSTPNDEDYSEVHIEVTAKNNSADDNAAFGIICHQGIPDSNLYYGAITPNGQYAIVKGVVALDDEVLSNGGEWGDSDKISQGAASYRIGMDCGAGTLTLYVDGQQVASVQDASYSSGTVALFAWTDEEENGAEVTFDDFVITKLENK